MEPPSLPGSSWPVELGGGARATPGDRDRQRHHPPSPKRVCSAPFRPTAVILFSSNFALGLGSAVTIPILQLRKVRNRN